MGNPQTSAQPPESQSEAEQLGSWQNCREAAPQDLVDQRPFISFLDMLAGVIDQMHVMDTGWTGGHAAETGETAIDMGDDRLGRRAAAFEHVLDQIDAAARAVQFVAAQQIGRTGCRTEAAMNAVAQDLVRLGDIRIGQLRKGEGCLHAGLLFTTAPRGGRH